MSYRLGHLEEFERFERGSTLPLYDYRNELEGLTVKKGANILDAGCGSGIVSRYLAQQFPSSLVTACDYIPSLLAKAREVAGEMSNIIFEEQDLRSLKYPCGHFDLIVSRFVLHHQDPEGLSRVIDEWSRVLRPGGTLVVIDIDGVFINLYPQTPRVRDGLQKLANAEEFDLTAGRKIPYLLYEAGLMPSAWRVETMTFRGDDKEHELEQLQVRFRNGTNFFEKAFGSPEEWAAFSCEYLKCLRHPFSVCFCNKFIVHAVKPLSKVQ